MHLHTFSEKSITLKGGYSMNLTNVLASVSLPLFFFLALPGRWCILAVSLLAWVCKAYCQQFTDTEGLSGEQTPMDNGKNHGTKVRSDRNHPLNGSAASSIIPTKADF